LLELRWADADADAAAAADANDNANADTDTDTDPNPNAYAFDTGGERRKQCDQQRFYGQLEQRNWSDGLSARCFHQQFL
jgi:hypothetical protein